MKKILTIILFFVAVSASAQHLKFMGIPLDGSIDMFQSKLLAKGLTFNKELTSQFNLPDVRVYEGIFCGYQAGFSAYFDTKTKVVCGCKVIITDSDLKLIKLRYNKIAEMLKDKYQWAYFTEGKKNGYDAFSMTVLKDGESNCDLEKSLGCINLYISEYPSSYMTLYTLEIEYNDRINFQKHESSTIDDL